MLINRQHVVLLALLIATCVSVAGGAETFYISPLGNDAWSGKRVTVTADKSDGPFATLERARDAIRELIKANKLPDGGVVVEIAEGTYGRERAFELTSADSGTADKPIVYRAAKNGTARFIGGKAIDEWKPVEDPETLAKLDPLARPNVIQADLKARDITEYGEVAGGGLELFFRNEPMQLSRWPNEGFVKIRDVTAEDPVEVYGRKGSKAGKFYYEGDRPKRWKNERNVWLHGYWFWDWSDAYQRVANVDADRQLIELAAPLHGYGYLAGARYFALNALSELDRPGEWQLDRERGLLYFWPPAKLERGQAVVSTIPNLVVGSDVSHVTLEGLTLEAVRGTAVKFTGGTGTRVVGCTIRNTGDKGVELRGGTKNAVVDCDIYNTAAGGIVLSGGDRATLTNGENLAANNHIRDFSRWKRTYAPGITVEGVGNRVWHNLFHDAPHNAVQLAGNEHIIECNEFHHVCLETDDVGAFYMGRDWTQRGNIVRYNYFHHLGKSGGGVGVMAIYLDDWSSGTTIFGNVCYKAGRAVLVGGGRDNTVDNNVFVDCTPSVHVDSRGLGWAKSYFDNTDNTLVTRLNAVDYRHPPWSTRYPQLLTLYGDEPALAKGNVITRNISVGGRWLDLADGLNDKVVRIDKNLVDVDPHFVDASQENFQLRDDSPAFASGFQRLPNSEMGLQRSERRPQATKPLSSTGNATSATR